MKSNQLLKRCPKCKQEKNTDLFGKEQRRPDGLRIYCRSCSSDIQKEHYDSKKRVSSVTEWRSRNKERVRLYQRQYKDKTKALLVSGYGGKCTCCGEKELTFLTVEHLNCDGKKHRAESGNSDSVYRDIIKRGFPKEYTVLCMNCNFAKRFGKTCPHVKANC